VEARDVVALLGPIVAIISVGVNFYQAYLLRMKRPQVARVGDIREAFQKMINSFGGRVMKTAPFLEIWDFGFDSLEEIRDCLHRVPDSNQNVIYRKNPRGHTFNSRRTDGTSWTSLFV
jgi:hypothetical protein